MKLPLAMIGGGFGATMRYSVHVVLPAESIFSYARLIMNASESFLMSAIRGLFIGGMALSKEMQLFLLVGILGATTKFSELFSSNS